jgi:hypothetical protein
MLRAASPGPCRLVGHEQRGSPGLAESGARRLTSCSRHPCRRVRADRALAGAPGIHGRHGGARCAVHNRAREPSGAQVLREGRQVQGHPLLAADPLFCHCQVQGHPLLAGVLLFCTLPYMLPLPAPGTRSSATGEAEAGGHRCRAALPGRRGRPSRCAGPAACQGAWRASWQRP